MFCPLGLFLVCFMLHMESAAPQQHLSYEAMAPLCVQGSCIAEITVSIEKWKNQKRAKMMTQISLFSSLSILWLKKIIILDIKQICSYLK